MVMALAQVVLEAEEQAAYDSTRQLILNNITTTLTAQFQALIGVVLGVVNLAPAPPAIPLPHPPGGTISPTAGAFTLAAGTNSIHLAYDYTGNAGNTALLTRTMLLRNTATGLPLDALGISMRNDLLVSLIRPAATARFFLNADGFLAGHPCFWIGNAIFPFPTGTPMELLAVAETIAIRSLVVGIDGTNFRLIARFRMTGIASSFTVDTTIDQSFALTAEVGANNTLTLTSTPAGPPIVSNSDANIAWWVYASAAIIAAKTGGLAAGFTAVAVLAAIDVFGGTFANGLLAGILAPLVPTVALPPAPLPAGVPALAVRGVSLTQPGSVRRPPATLAIPGIQPIPVPDPFLAEDVLINFV
jgi:hypothetical protein